MFHKNCLIKAIFLLLPYSIFSANTFMNPLLATGPDPWVLKVNNTYYHTHTMWNHIELYKTHEMSEIGQTQPMAIWWPPKTGPYSTDIWAPEIHYINGKFYIYFAAADENGKNNRCWVIENDGPDPMNTNWTMKGKVYDINNDEWALDPDSFEYQGKRYFVWAGIPGNTGIGHIFIASMSNPWTLSSSRVSLSQPTYDWEDNGYPTNEGPEGLISPNGQLFIVYSASGCNTDDYCLGLLILTPGGDPLNANDWTKFSKPVFTKSPGNGAYGPGHNGFFKSLDETEDWIIYHANNHTNQGCGGLRNPRIQKFTWGTNGLPNFGIPVPIQTPIPKPSGET
jgi:GH43 family beta-xylosidase